MGSLAALARVGAMCAESAGGRRDLQRASGALEASSVASRDFKPVERPRLSVRENYLASKDQSYTEVAMSEHVIHNPVPTPEHMAELLGVSPARVLALRGIMRPSGPDARSERNGAGLRIEFKKAQSGAGKKSSSRARAKAR